MLHTRFKFNLRFKTFGEVAARLSALLIYAAGARLLGTDGFGLFSLALSYAALASVLIDSGTLNIITRDLARNRAAAPELIRSVTLYKALMSPVAVAVVYFGVRLMNPGVVPGPLLLVAGLWAIGTSLTEHLYAVLSGLERMDVEALVKISNRIGAFVFAVALFYLHRSVATFTLGTAVGLGIGVIIGVWWLHTNVGRWSFRIEWPMLMTVLKTSVPLFVAWLFITLYGNQDRYVMASLHFSKADIGVYSAAAKLVDALRPIPVLLMGAVFPIVAEAAVKDRALFEKIAGTLIKYSVIGLFPFAFGVTVFSPLVVRIIFGPQFAVTGGILAVAIWGYVGIFLNHLFQALLVSSDRQSKFLYGSMISMLVNLPLCWWFFQRMGPAGGAWALIGSESALLIFSISASPWARPHLATLFGRPFVLAGSSLALFWLVRMWIPSPVAFLAAIALYGVLVWRSSLVDVSLLRRFVV